MGDNAKHAYIVHHFDLLSIMRMLAFGYSNYSNCVFPRVLRLSTKSDF